MRKMNRTIQIVWEDYYPKWNSTRIVLEAHVTMSSSDIIGRSIWVNTYNEKPLLLGDLYNPDHENTFTNVFENLDHKILF